MATITKPHTFSNGSIIDALQFNANFDTIYSEFNGNIDNANIKVGAGIEGTKLADSPSGIPTSKINTNAVTSTKLSSSLLVDADRAVTTDHIRDDAVTAAKLKDSVGVDGDRAVTKDHLRNGSVVLNKLGGNFQRKAFSVSANEEPTGLPSFDTFVHSVETEVNGANWRARVHMLGFGFDAGGNFNAKCWANFEVIPDVAIPTATHEIISIYIEDAFLEDSTSLFTGTVVFVSIPKT